MKKLLLPVVVLGFLSSAMSAFAAHRDLEARDLKTLYKMCRFPQTFGFQHPIEDLAVDCKKIELNWEQGETKPIGQMGDNSVVVMGTLFAKKRYMHPNEDTMNPSAGKDEPYFQSMGRSTLSTLEEIIGVPMGGTRVQWQQVETESVGQGTITCTEFIELFDQMGQDQNLINKICTDKYNVNWYPSKKGRVVKTLVL